MFAAVCVDDGMGMLFNRRRLSRDSAQQEDMLRLCGGKKLWISPFSARMMEPFAECLTMDADFLRLAGCGDVCFVEDQALLPWLERLEGIILYRWNRRYPSDTMLDVPLDRFVCKERVEFSGTSHETITREIYIKA